MPRGNPAVKLAVTVDADVHSKVIDAAEAEGKSVSAWITEAARRALLVRDGLAAVAEWESVHGALTPAELAAARAASSERLRGGSARRDETSGLRRQRLIAADHFERRISGRAPGSPRSGPCSAGAGGRSRSGEPLSEAGTDEAPASRSRSHPVRRTGGARCRGTTWQNTHAGRCRRISGRAFDSEASRHCQRRRRRHSKTLGGG